MESLDKDNLISKILIYRTLIGFLGEISQYNWWDTSFFNKTSFSFLEINFPRTALSASIKSVSEAAKRVHDARIGKGRIIHLFRLPISIEQKITTALRNVNGDDLPKYIIDINTASAKLDEISLIESNNQEGPSFVPEATTFLSEQGLKEIVGRYHLAFKNNCKTFPYTIIEKL
jgi:hypothetical protein